jgi:DNA-binding NtrC family response regulator
VPRRRNEETGQYEEVYSDEAILKRLRDTRLSTSEIANELGCHRTTAYDRLAEMEERNKVSSSAVGNTLIWEIP